MVHLFVSTSLLLHVLTSRSGMSLFGVTGGKGGRIRASVARDCSGVIRLGNLREPISIKLEDVYDSINITDSELYAKGCAVKAKCSCLRLIEPRGHVDRRIPYTSHDNKPAHRSPVCILALSTRKKWILDCSITHVR